MIGLTIGTGVFRRLAGLAAQSFRDTTGLDCIVLGDAEYASSGVGHPYFLRYKMFNYTQEQTVVYFDSDIKWCREWDPTALFDGTFTAVRDLTRAKHIQHEASMIGLPADDYFNSGFFIIDRTDPLLKGAARYAEMLDAGDYQPTPAFPDQTPLNVVRHITGAPIKWLPRIYNWVCTAHQWERRGIPIVGMHKPVHGATMRQLLDMHTAPALEIGSITLNKNAWDECAGTYEYMRRGDASTSRIGLRPDGTLVHDGTLEQWWFVTQEGELWVLGAHQENHHYEYHTMTLQETSPGKWAGRWNHFEKMPVTLERV